MVSSERKDGTFRRFRRTMPAAAWIAVGLLGAAVIAPATAVAASNLVGIVGSNGARANVTSDGAVQTADASPSSFVAAYGYDLDATCNLVYTVPKGYGLVITGVTFNTLSATTTGSGYFTGLYTASTCPGDSYFLDDNPPGTGEETVPLDPGYALKSGTSIYVYAASPLESEVYVNGYLVPSKDVPKDRIPPAAVRKSSAQRRG